MSTGYKGTTYSTSREMAAKLRQLADWLDSRDNFDMENGAHLSSYYGKLSISFNSKDKFVAAVKALGDVDKEYTQGDSFAQLLVHAKWSPITLSIFRDKVCTKKVIYDCEPLFSAEEMKVL